MVGVGILEVVSLLNKICESVEKVLPVEDAVALANTRNALFDRLNIGHNGSRFALKQLKTEVSVPQCNAKAEELTQNENVENEKAVLRKELQALRESSNVSIKEAESMVRVLQQVVAELEKQVGKPSPDQLQNPDYCTTFNDHSKGILASMLLECSKSLDAEKSVADSLRMNLEEQKASQSLANDCQVRDAAAYQATVDKRQEELERIIATHKQTELQLKEDRAFAQQDVIKTRNRCEELEESNTSQQKMVFELQEALRAKGDDLVSANKAAYEAKSRCDELEVKVTEYQEIELHLNQILEAKDDLLSEQKCATEDLRKRCKELEAAVANKQLMISKLEEGLGTKTSSSQISAQQESSDTIKYSQESEASLAERQQLELHRKQAFKAEEGDQLLSTKKAAADDARKRCEELEASVAGFQRMEAQLQERLKVEEEEKVAAQNAAVGLTQKCEELGKLVATHKETELELKKKLDARDEDERSQVRKDVVDSNAEQLNIIIDKLKGELSYAEERLRISEAENVALVNGSISSALDIRPADVDTEYAERANGYGIRDEESGETDGERGSSVLSFDVPMNDMFEEYELPTISTKANDRKMDLNIPKLDRSIHNKVDSTNENDVSTEQPTIPVSHDLHSDKRENCSEEPVRASNHLMASSLWSPMPSADINRRLEDDTLLVLETGDWQVRMGLIDIKGGHSYYDEFACCLARPRRNTGEASDLVNMASGVSAKMYSSFRSEGVFVGADAWFCCMDHPDAGLRAKLELSSPLERGHIIHDRMDDLQRLWAAAFKKSKVESSLTPTIVTFKPNATSEEVRAMVRIMLDQFKVPAVRMVNEASVIALADGITTGIVVNLGHTSTFVCPIFEGCVISDTVRTENVGGKDIDRTNEDYNQMVERRRLDYARAIKEQHCYVAKNFAVEAGTAGHFQRKSMRVFGVTGEADEKLSKYDAMTTSEYYDQQNEDDPVEVSFTQKNGKELLLKVGRERFHAPEILFNPSIWEDSENSVSLSALIVDAVMTCHADIRLPLVKNVILTGNTSKILGLEERLQMELELELSESLCDEPVVRTIDDKKLYPTSSMSRATPSAVLKGSELLFSKESDCHDSWILQSDYEKDPSVIQQHYYFCSD